MQVISSTQTPFTNVSDISIPDIFYKRLLTGVEEIDNMFGNGILPGCSFTVTAQAGCGKTTLLLQLVEALSVNNYEVGYASGEENIYQLAYTCKRLNIKNVNIANITDIDTLVEATKTLDVLVIDSFQALTTPYKLNSRELETYAVQNLVKAAKTNECALFFIMHLTKDGKLKGSTLVPHAVDVNIQIMLDTESEDPTSRIISFYKNRFGPTSDYAATMTSSGFEFSGRVEVERTSGKNGRKQASLKKILEMNEPPYITKERVIEELNVTSSQAYLLLKELRDTGKLVKYGRGDEAVYKVKQVTEAVEV